MAERKSGREPKGLDELLKTLVSGRGWEERMALGRLRDAWLEVVGEQVGARSEPVLLERGVLTVRAEGGVWATELTLLAAHVAARADDFLGGGFVRRVTVHPGR